MLVSKKTLAVMQIFAGPCLFAEPALGLPAELAQPPARAPGPILMLGEIGEELAHQSVHRGVSFGGMPANSGENVIVDT